MKLDKILEETIKIKLNPRKPIFFTRVKMFIFASSEQWVENCKGILIVYTLNSFYYMTILNISNFQIQFDMQIFTNFLNYTKWMRETRSLHFLIPCQGEKIMALLVLQSKQELIQLKRKFETIIFKVQISHELDFFQRPEVKQLINQADITEQALETHPKLRNEVQAEIKSYFAELEQLQKKSKNSGFKAYGLGRQEWKLEQNQKEYIKQKKKTQIISMLTRISKQNRLLQKMSKQ